MSARKQEAAPHGHVDWTSTRALRILAGGALVGAIALNIYGGLVYFDQDRPFGWSPLLTNFVVSFLWAALVPVIDAAENGVRRFRLARPVGGATRALLGLGFVALHLLMLTSIAWLRRVVTGDAESFWALLSAWNRSFVFVEFCAFGLIVVLLRFAPLASATDGTTDDASRGGKGLLGAADPDHLAVRAPRGVSKILRVRDIDWVETGGGRTLVHVGDTSYACPLPLGELLEEIPDHFVRIHRSAGVNLNRVDHLYHWSHGDYRVVLRSGEELKLSRRYRSVFEERIAGKIRG